MVKKIQMMSHDKEWQVVDGVETLVPVEQFDIDPVTDSSCVKIEGFRTLEETLNEKNMFTPEVNATKVMDKVGGEYHQNVVDGAYEEAILYGNTQVNLCEEDTSNVLQIPTTFTSFNNGELQINNKENQVVAPLIKGVTMVNLAQERSATFDTSNSYVVENVKGNTTYTVFFNFTVKNTNAGIIIQSYNGNTYLENSIHKTQLGDKVKFTFTTHSDANRFSICNPVAYGGQTIQLDDIMVIEGDQTALDIPFFKGMKSVELVRPLTNLFTDDITTYESGASATNSSGNVTVTSKSSSSWSSIAFKMNMLKNNTKYLVMWDSLNTTQTSTSNTGHLIGIYYVDTSSQNIGTINNNTLCPTKKSLIFDTKDFDVTKLWLKIHATLNNTETGTTTVTGLRVFEYDDYLRSVDLQSIGYFSGTKNVAIEPIKTCSKNLYPYGDINFIPTSAQAWFDAKGNGSMTGDIALKSQTRFLLKKGTYTITLSSTTNGGIQVVGDKEEIITGGITSGIGCTTFTLERDTYCTVRFKSIEANVSCTATNIQIERGETATDYVAHDSRYYEPDGQNTIVLRSLPDGVCDTFNLQTGEYIQRIGVIILDGDEQWILSTNFSSTYNSYYFVLNEAFRNNIKYANDKYQLLSGGEDLGKKIGIHMGSSQGKIAPFISSDKMTLSEFKEYLQQNPVTVQYELETPITTIIPRTIKRNNNGTVSTVDFKTYTNKESLVLPKNPTFLTINGMTSIKPVVEPITYIDFKTRLKTNTDYSIIMDKNSTDKTINLGGTSKTYVDKMLVRTPSVNLEQNLRISGSGTIQNIMVIEGDVLDKELPYFNGMCNVKMPIVRNCGKNLFDGTYIEGFVVDGNNYTVSYDTDVTSILVKVNKNTDYILSTKTYFNRSEIGGSIQPISIGTKTTKIKNYRTGNTITFNSGEYTNIILYLNSSKIDIEDIQIEEGTTATSHEPYRGNDICIAQGEIDLPKDMFEQGGFSTNNGSTYETMKYNSATRLRSKSLIKVKPNTTYYIKNNLPRVIFNLYQWNASVEFMQGTSKTNNASELLFTTTNDTHYIHFLFSKYGNENITVSEFDWNFFQLLELDSTVQLRSLPNGVKDELNLLNGEYIQRVGEVVLDGSSDEGWQVAAAHTGGSTRMETQCISGLFVGVETSNDTPNMKCDQYDAFNFNALYGGGKEGIAFYSNTHVVVYDSKYTNINSFLARLQKNPITVQYQLAEPIISYPRIVSNTQEREVGVKLPNGICDTYNPSTGITVKRVGKVVLDGSEDWVVDTTKTNTQVFRLAIIGMNTKTDNNIVCNELPIGDGSTSDTEKIATSSSSNSLYIALLKTKASTVAELKTYLASNPITAWYELTNPIVTTDIVLPNGVHDKYNPLTGLYTKRVGYVELDGSEDEGWMWGAPATGTDVNTKLFLSPCPQAQIISEKENCNIICDKLPYLYELWDTDQEGVHIFSNTTHIAIRVTKSKLSEETLVGLKTYLSQNPIKVWYELATPITYQLTPYFGLPMPYAYKDGYLIMDSAYDGQTLPPEIKYKLLANRTGQITQNNIKLQNHTSKLSNLEAMLIEATLQSMYEREMMAFNLEMVNINLINLEE